MQGISKAGIVLQLNERLVASPSVYKKSKGLNYKTNLTVGQAMWCEKHIDTILTHPIYTGDMVQGRRRKKSYKMSKVVDVPKEDWIVVENTHEAIIDKQTFEKVQQMLKRDTRTAPKQKQVYLFSGFLRCADCGKAVNRGGSGGNVRYYCSTYRTRSRLACTSHAIQHNRLEAALLYAIQQQVYIAVSYSEMIETINMAPIKKNQSIRLNGIIIENEKKLAKIAHYKQSIYEDWKDGALSQSDYSHMKNDYDQQALSLNGAIRSLRAEQHELENCVSSESLFLTTFRKYENIDTLTREILIELVDYIKVYEGGDISIKFKFADEYRRIAEYIEANKKVAV